MLTFYDLILILLVFEFYFFFSSVSFSAVVGNLIPQLHDISAFTHLVKSHDLYLKKESINSVTSRKRKAPVRKKTRKLKSSQRALQIQTQVFLRHAFFIRVKLP